jgi:hypothetical protein
VGAANAAVGGRPAVAGRLGRLGGLLLNEFGNGVAPGIPDTGVVTGRLGIPGIPDTGVVTGRLGTGVITGSWGGIPLGGVALGTSTADG